MTLSRRPRNHGNRGGPTATQRRRSRNGFMHPISDDQPRLPTDEDLVCLTGTVSHSPRCPARGAYATGRSQRSGRRKAPLRLTTRSSVRSLFSFAGRIRVYGRIWCTIVHRKLPEARILPDLQTPAASLHAQLPPGTTATATRHHVPARPRTADTQDPYRITHRCDRLLSTASITSRRTSPALADLPSSPLARQMPQAQLPGAPYGGAWATGPGRCITPTGQDPACVPDGDPEMRGRCATGLVTGPQASL
jgi:hypothetical protein